MGHLLAFRDDGVPHPDAMPDSTSASSSPELSGAERLRQERAQYTIRSSSAPQSDSDGDFGIWDDKSASPGQSAPLSYAEAVADGNALPPGRGKAASVQHVDVTSQSTCNNAVAAAILDILHDGVSNATHDKRNSSTAARLVL